MTDVLSAYQLEWIEVCNASAEAKLALDRAIAEGVEQGAMGENLLERDRDDWALLAVFETPRRVGDAPIALTTFAWFDNDAREISLIVGWTDPAYRRRGLARAMARFIADQLKATKLIWMSRPDNKAAQAFAAKMVGGPAWHWFEMEV